MGVEAVGRDGHGVVGNRIVGVRDLADSPIGEARDSLSAVSRAGCQAQLQQGFKRGEKSGLNTRLVLCAERCRRASIASTNSWFPIGLVR